MARLVLKFQSQVLREISIGTSSIGIGRAPDNDVHIDNPAVSDHHARLSIQGDKMVIEDLGSLNGTLVNDLRINRATLRDGDNIQIGSHLLQVDTVHEASTTVADAVSGGRTTPRSQNAQDADDPVLNTDQKTGGPHRSDPLPIPALDRSRAPILRVLRGRADQREYLILSKLTVIGASEMASVRMRGWFCPEIGAQINRHHDGYYLGMGDVTPEINGQPIKGPTQLRDGDTIQVGRLRLQFSQPHQESA